MLEMEIFLFAISCVKPSRSSTPSSNLMNCVRYSGCVRAMPLKSGRHANSVGLSTAMPVLSTPKWWYVE